MAWPHDDAFVTKAGSMIFPPHLGSDFMRIVKPVCDSDKPDHIKLQKLWETLATVQGVLIGHLLASRIGDSVFAGPFRGMRLVKDMMTRPFAPELLGTSQWEIHDKMEELFAQPYRHVLVAGCACGYTSTGFALRMPRSIVHVGDTRANARDLCKKMAEANHVEDRVLISEKADPDTLKNFPADETLLVIEDTQEGAAFLDPAHTPLLARMDLLVKLPHAQDGTLAPDVPQRFAATHEIRLVRSAPFAFPLDKILGPDCPLDHFDSLLATWEHRDGPVSYGLFLRKRFTPDQTS